LKWSERSKKKSGKEEAEAKFPAKNGGESLSLVSKNWVKRQGKRMREDTMGSKRKKQVFALKWLLFLPHFFLFS